MFFWKKKQLSNFEEKRMALQLFDFLEQLTFGIFGIMDNLRNLEQ